MSDVDALGLLELVVAALLVMLAVSLAVWLRPWRQLWPHGPPWPWLALSALLPLFWDPALWTGLPTMPALSGAVLLVLLMGWPLAVLALVAGAAVLACGGGLTVGDMVLRLLCLGVLPATLALLAGAVVRRCWPHRLWAYLLGRAFLGSLLALFVAAMLALALQPAAPTQTWGDALAARLLLSFGEATLTAGLVSLLVALRPRWLATYADRLYLPQRTLAAQR